MRIGTDEEDADGFVTPAAKARIEEARRALAARSGDDYKARAFLARPHPGLGGRRPLDLLLEGGEDAVRRVLDLP